MLSKLDRPPHYLQMYFYLPQILDKNLTGIIEPPYLDHFNSLRVGVGEVVLATDFKGVVAKIEMVVADHKKKLYQYKILELKTEPKPPSLVLFQAILDKAYLEKMVEILPHTSIDHIVLFDAKNSLKHTPNLNRLNLILQRSCSQAQNPFLPKLEVVETKLALQEIKTLKPIWLDENGIQLRDLLAINKSNLTGFLTGFLAGPEGGFDDGEKQIFEDFGLEKISLGNKVLAGWMAGPVASWQCGA